MTFNTPEATEYIINYLKTRDNIKEDEPLFLSQYKKSFNSTWCYLAIQRN